MLHAPGRGFIVKTNNDTFKCDNHLTVTVRKVLPQKDSFLNMSLSKLVTVYSNYDTENEKNNKFLNVCGFSTESFLAISLSKYSLVSYKNTTPHPVAQSERHGNIMSIAITCATEF